MINHPIVSIDFGRDRAGVTVSEIGGQHRPQDPNRPVKMSIKNAPSSMEDKGLRRAMMQKREY